MHTSLNLILRFSTASQDDSCGFSATRRAPTFTTASIPILPVCFDLADLFGGNATSGFVNQTGNQPAVAGEKGLHWSILNADEYDASANYSSVMYRQHLLNPNTDDQKPGHPARRRATLYPGKGCTEKDPNDENGLQPWYGFSCWSEDEGSCGTAPYSFQSFYIQAGNEDRKCWEFARNGQSGAVRMSKSVVAAFVGTSVALWLAL